MSLEAFYAARKDVKIAELTDSQLAEFNELLPWEFSFQLPDGRFLGKPVFGPPVDKAREPDFWYRFIPLMPLNPADKTVLEVGCHEGYYTVELSRLCKFVTAVEVRPKNILCALTRLWTHGVENAKLLLKDVRDIDKSFGCFDIIFHSGVLYHLENPVEHLYKIAPLAEAIVLDTHYCIPEESFTNDFVMDGEHRQTHLIREDIQYQGKTYKAFIYKEHGWQNSLSGAEDFSKWLHIDSLYQVLAEVGFDRIKVYSEYELNGSSRILLLAQKSG